jgi:hypothetical protein
MTVTTGGRGTVSSAVDFALDAQFDIGFRDAAHAVAEFGDNQLGRVGVDRLGDGRHHAHAHQRLDHIAAALGHTLGQFLHGDGFRQHDVADDLHLLVVAAMARRSFSRARRTAARLRMRMLSPSLVSAWEMVSLPVRRAPSRLRVGGGNLGGKGAHAALGAGLALFFLFLFRGLAADSAATLAAADSPARSAMR